VIARHSCQPDSLFQPSQQLSQRDYVEESSEEADIISEFPSVAGQGIVRIAIVDSVEDNDHPFVPSQPAVEAGTENYPPDDGLGAMRHPI